MNYVDKVRKVEDILNNWQKKRFLPGKITIAIIKTIGLRYVIRYVHVLSR